MTDVVINLAGCEALLVWTIPYATSRRLSPDGLLLRLIDADYEWDCGNTFPTAFTLDSHGNPVLIPRNWWMKKLNRMEKLCQETDDGWDKRSIEVLMEDEGCYIWLDEFKQWFNVYKRVCHDPIPGKFQPETLFDQKVVGALQPEIFLSPLLPAEHQQFFEDQKLKISKCSMPLETVSPTQNEGGDYDFRKDLELTKLEKQRCAILEVCNIKEYRPLAVPDGGKVTLRQICEAHYPDLFDGETSFENAWKASKKLFRMANHASFSKRGRG
ncbi:MAG: hypothetical protein ACR65R_21095 [Methylomicrobium sp.]